MKLADTVLYMCAHVYFIGPSKGGSSEEGLMHAFEKKGRFRPFLGLACSMPSRLYNKTCPQKSCKIENSVLLQSKPLFVIVWTKNKQLGFQKVLERVRFHILSQLAMLFDNYVNIFTISIPSLIF